MRILILKSVFAIPGLMFFGHLNAQNKMAENSDNTENTLYSKPVEKFNRLHKLSMAMKLDLTVWFYAPIKKGTKERLDLKNIINEEYPALKIDLTATTPPEFLIDTKIILQEVDSLTESGKSIMNILNSEEDYDNPNQYFSARLIYEEFKILSNKTESKIVKLLNELETSQLKEQTQREYNNKLIKFGLIASSIVVLVLALLFFHLISSRNQIRKQRDEIASKKHLIEEKQQEILDSITYAKRLQNAILPPDEFINKAVPENFVLYKPKDIVAGDFYWADKINDTFFIAAADSTGHGVPGALVSVVCSNALNRTIKEFKLTETGKILDKTRDLVLETFEKSTSEVKDGMDISLLSIDSESKTIFWSGANNPLWYVNNNELKEIKADKQPIGKTENPKSFTTHFIEFKKNTTFYLFTDGLADQFGGPKGKKFKYKQLEELLVAINDRSLQEQSDIINQKFESWKGTLEQVDDVCVIGIKI